jgi:hypothetical protein
MTFGSQYIRPGELYHFNRNRARIKSFYYDILTEFYNMIYWLLNSHLYISLSYDL